MTDTSEANRAYNRGVTASHAGDRPLALQEYTRAIQIDSKCETPARLNRAEIYLELQLWDAAASDASAVLNFRPRDPHAFNLRGRAHFGKGEFLQAIEDQTKAIVFENEGLWDFSYLWRGQAYAAIGEFYLAIADFDRADGANTMLNQVLMSRAAAYEAIGEPEAAQRDRDRAASRLIPPRPELDARLQALVSDWCRRELLGPLKWLLGGWPLKTGAIDEWISLGSALAAAQFIERKTLSNEEVQQLVAARDMVDKILKAR